MSERRGGYPAFASLDGYCPQRQAKSDADDDDHQVDGIAQSVDLGIYRGEEDVLEHLSAGQRTHPPLPEGAKDGDPRGLPDTKLERLYRETDWKELSSGDKAFLSIQGRQVPYAMFDNLDDVTTGRGAALGDRLEAVTRVLWEHYNHRER